MKKKLVYIDLDDTIADFTGDPVFDNGFDVAKMYEVGFFQNLKVIEGAHVAVRQIMRMGYDVQILSQPVAETVHSYSEKVRWVGMHFPDLIGKINFTQDKGNFVGDYLIDDNPGKWEQAFEANGGEFLTFLYTKSKEPKMNNRYNWEQIVEYLKHKMNDEKR